MLVFGNIQQPPFLNNQLPMIRALEKLTELRLVEPFQIEGFVPTGGASPAKIPPGSALQVLEEFVPEAVLCLGGGLYLDRETREQFPEKSVFAASPPAASTRASSPPETMSKPAPSFASRASTARLELALTE